MLQDISTDTRFADIGNLPSNFFPYKTEFNALNIRQFNVSELKLLSRATLTKNVASTIRAVDQTIDVPVQRLTIGDFYYVLMWHKLHSFPKTPLNVQWECLNNVPVDKEGILVQDPENNQSLIDRIQPCKHPNAQLIHQSLIETIDFEDDFEGIPPQFDYPRVALLPEIFELRNDPEYSMLIGSAQWIREGHTLLQKFQYLESLPDLAVYEEAEHVNTTIVHGVKEQITLSCARCENKFVKQLELDPLNFFRPGL